MTFSVVLAMSSLLITIVLCVAGLFCINFHDNWLQHVGMIGTGTSAAILLHVIHDARYVPPEMFIMTVSLCAYGLGTAYKVWHFKLVDLVHDKDDPKKQT